MVRVGRFWVWCVVSMVACAEGVVDDGKDSGASPTEEADAADTSTADDGADDGADGSDEGAGGTGGDDSDGGDGSGDTGDGEGGGGDDGGDTGDTEPPPPALPVEGAWSLTDFSVADDPCGVGTYQDPAELVAERYTVAHVDAATFALAADGQPPGDCVVADGGGFLCAAAQLREDLSGFGIDADMLVDTQLSGVLGPDFRTMSGTTDITVTCDGDCWLLEFVLDFPCPMTVDMTLDAG